ncbi:MAG: hypothetical protein PHI12_11380 [Dehalococcoidales bacterium]|nr:hypothetical protein [Dehalococcoidales bacterium]
MKLCPMLMASPLGAEVMTERAPMECCGVQCAWFMKLEMGTDPDNDEKGRCAILELAINSKMEIQV